MAAHSGGGNTLFYRWPAAREKAGATRPSAHRREALIERNRPPWPAVAVADFDGREEEISVFGVFGDLAEAGEKFDASQSGGAERPVGEERAARFDAAQCRAIRGYAA